LKEDFVFMMPCLLLIVCEGERATIRVVKQAR
jgi:hypothetical protein